MTVLPPDPEHQPTTWFAHPALPVEGMVEVTPLPVPRGTLSPFEYHPEIGWTTTWPDPIW